MPTAITTRRERFSFIPTDYYDFDATLTTIKMYRWYQRWLAEGLIWIGAERNQEHGIQRLTRLPNLQLWNISYGYLISITEKG